MHTEEYIALVFVKEELFGHYRTLMPSATHKSPERRGCDKTRVVSTSSVGRRMSLSGARTLQQLHRAAATARLKDTAPLFSFKREDIRALPTQACTIAAASREQANRLYNGPTVRLAGGWEARFDSPGPQAYNESQGWQKKLSSVPSARIAFAVNERDIAIPQAPGPGDYDIAHPAVGDDSNAHSFGDPDARLRYPPRTPDRPRSQVPCSFVEHVSCLNHQVTSDRARSPAFRFSSAPRFQVRRRLRGVTAQDSSMPRSNPPSRICEQDLPVYHQCFAGLRQGKSRMLQYHVRK